MMRIASFFSGIGGLELGLEAALSARTVFQCERDPYAVSVLERRWPGVARSDDITALSGDEIPAADVWCGGFPCQDISLAGKGAGLDGDRSGLWWEWHRLIRDVGPRFVVLENVAAFLVRGLDRVLGALSECGYDAEWSRLSAADVGAPHLRRRLFVIAWRSAVRDSDSDSESAGAFHAEAPGVSGDLRPEQSGDVAHPGSRRGPGDGLRPGRDELGRRRAPLGEPSGPGLAQRGGREAERAHAAASGAGWWAAEPHVGRVAHGVPARVDRLRCLGNAVVPRCAYLVGLRLAQIIEPEVRP